MSKVLLMCQMTLFHLIPIVVIIYVKEVFMFLFFMIFFFLSLNVCLVIVLNVDNVYIILERRIVMYSSLDTVSAFSGESLIEKPHDFVVCCESPRIIMNPRFAELLARYHCYVFRGERHFLDRPWKSADDINVGIFGVVRNSICHDDLSDCYVLDLENGVSYPMYLEVPCGKCDICIKVVKDDFVRRCEYETQMHKCRPWFVTLTYNDKNYPKPGYHSCCVIDYERMPRYFFVSDESLNSVAVKFVKEPTGGVLVRDVQLFLKRFRINLVRSGFNFSLRYCCVGEYGDTTKRGHYHLIFWGIESYSLEDYKKVKDCLFSSWSLGFVKSRIIDTSDSNTFAYTCYYMKKQSSVPDGCRKGFFLSSRGHGGIGSGFIDKCAPFVRKTMKTDYKYKDKFTGKIKQLVFSRYVLNRIFPTFCSLVKSSYRRSVQCFVHAFRNFEIVHGVFDFGSRIEQQLALCEKYFYTGLNCIFSRLVHGIHGNNEYAYLSQVFHDSMNFDLFMYDAKYFEYASYSQEKRDVFIAKLFKNKCPTDVFLRAYSARKFNNYKSKSRVL